MKASTRYADHVYLSRMLNEAVLMMDNGRTILKSMGLEFNEFKIKSISQVNVKNSFVTFLIILAHIEIAGLSTKASHDLCYFYMKWAIILGPETAIKRMAEVLRDPSCAHASMKKLRQMDVKYSCGYVKVDVEEFNVSGNHCLFPQIFGIVCKDKKCVKDHLCLFCKGDHPLERCPICSFALANKFKDMNNRSRNYKNNNYRVGYRNRSGNYNRRGGYNNGQYQNNHNNNNNHSNIGENNNNRNNSR